MFLYHRTGRKGEFEVEISNDDFKGFIDLLAPVTSDTRLGGDYQELPDVFDLYDFKYSNNVEHYKESPQLHLYKFFFENIILLVTEYHYLWAPVSYRMFILLDISTSWAWASFFSR